MKSATLHDVAREAGVSVITASRAINTPQRLAEPTLQRVLAAVARTGYVPNLLAGGLKSSKSRTVAALVPVVSVPQFLPTVQALTAELDRAGYQLILGQTGYDRAREEALLTAMLGRRVDGLVVAGLLAPGAAREQLRRLQLPVVETWDLSAEPVDMLVGFSHPAVGAAVAAFFNANGYQRVGVASADDARALQRCRAFTAAIQASGRAVPTALVPAPSNVRLGREALAQLLAQQPRLQAVLCSSDALAEGVMIEARARGIEVPRQLAVCGFGDADFAAHLLPSLTTVQIDGAGIGTRAAQMIVARCTGQAVHQRIVDMAFSIVERGSTARR